MGGVGGKVQSAGTVVQNQEFRFFHEGTGDGETLSLTAGEVPAVLLQMEIQLAVFFLDNLFAWAIVSASQMSLSVASSRPHFMLARILPWKRSAFWGTTPILSGRSAPRG